MLKRISAQNPNIVTLHDYFEVRPPSLSRSSSFLIRLHRPPTIYICASIYVPAENSLTAYAPKEIIMKRENIPLTSPHRLIPFNSDAAQLVRIVFGAVKYIHEQGIVHRDLKPENLLFRTKDEDADIMICDFGLSRVMDSEKLQLLTEICGTPGVRITRSSRPFLTSDLVHGSRNLQKE